MKKNSKLLAFLIVAAMVMSTMIIPVSVGAEVSETNMFGSLPFNQTGEFVPGMTDGDAADPKYGGWAKASTATITYDNTAGYATINNTAKGDGIIYTYANSLPNRKYIVSAYMKLQNPTDNVKAYVFGERAKSTQNTLPVPDTTSTEANAVALSSTEWTYVYGVFEFGDAETGEGRSAKGAHYRFRVTSANVPYYIRDIKMLDVTDGINLLHEFNPGFESGAIEKFANYFEQSYHTNSDGTAKHTGAGVTSEAGAAHSGMYGFKTGTCNNMADIRYIQYAHTIDQWYRASVWVKAGDAAAIGKEAKMAVQESGGGANEYGEAKKLSEEWQKISIEFKYTTAGKKIHFGPAIANVNNAYVDDFCLETFTPNAFTATMIPGTVGTESADIAVTFTNAPVSFTAANVEVSGGTVAVNGSGTNYTISLSGLTDGETYSVELKNVSDKYKQTANASTSITTVEKKAPVSENVIVADTIVENTGTKHTITPIVDGGWTVEKNADEWYRQVQKINVNVIPGKKYMVTAKVKNLDEDKTGDTANVTVVIAGKSTHGIKVDEKCAAIDISGEGWVDVCGVLTFSEGTCDKSCLSDKEIEAGTACKKAEHKIHFGVGTSQTNESFQLKDFTLTELTTLKYDPSYFAAVKDNRNGTASLYITKAEEASSVFFMAAAYDGAKLADVKCGKADVNEFASVITIDVPEDYTVFIWDGSFNPLTKKFLGSDF